MAIVKTIIKKTHQEAVVKVAGTAAAGTISLASDLLPTGQVLDGATQTVNIVGVTWSGAAAGVVTISRNSVVIMTLTSSGQLDFTGQNMTPDTIENASDIVVTISGGQAECWLRLRKVGGYKTTVEPDQFGIYDNPAVAGS
jgi:hypothetical protein